MAYIRFIHVADLQLDTPLAMSFITQEDTRPDMMHARAQATLQNATYKALDNLLELCKKKSPHFLIFAGNMYDSEDVNLKAHFALNTFFKELETLSIPVFYAHGHLDAVTAKAKKNPFYEAWPSNVFTFGGKWEHFAFAEDVNIYGISHTKRQESKNLTELFHQYPERLDTSKLNIGVLSTSLSTSLIGTFDDEINITENQDELKILDTQLGDLEDSSSLLYENMREMQESTEKNRKKIFQKLFLENLLEPPNIQKANDSLPLKITSGIFEKSALKKSSKVQKISKLKKSKMYAPCQIEDLEKIPMDYWALGHVHKAHMLSNTPPISYSGALQGLHIKETGSHGCLYVEIEKKKSQEFSAPKLSFYSLAPIEWHALRVNVGLLNEADIVENEQDYFIKNDNVIQQTQLIEKDSNHTELSIDTPKNKDKQHLNSITAKLNTDEYIIENKTVDGKNIFASQSLALQGLILQEVKNYFQKVWVGKKCEIILFHIELYGKSELAPFLHNIEIHDALCKSLEKILNQKETSQNIFGKNNAHVMRDASTPFIYFKDIKSFVRPDFDFDYALKRDDILGEVLRVSENLRNDKKMLREMEKQVSDVLRAKIVRYTSNLHENISQGEAKSVVNFIDKAEEICVEVFETEQK